MCKVIEEAIEKLEKAESEEKSGDLRNFKVDNLCSGNRLEIGITTDPTDMLYFSQHRREDFSVVHTSLKQAIEIHQKLGQVIATVQRSNAKKNM